MRSRRRMLEPSPSELALQHGFERVERVVADDIRFKLRLGIGEDAYTSMRVKKHIYSLWDMSSWGATGAAVAASKTVAGTFFAPTGFMAMLGFGTAVTPVGWVIASAVTSAGAYYGVTRLFARYEGARVDTIPKFINSPIDVLGAALFDLMGGLAIRVANIDGEVDDREIQAITDHFVGEWGLDPAYVASALPVLRADLSRATIKDMARRLARFQVENPDCNDVAMQAVLVDFLKEVAMADGVMDEREELAIDAIKVAMREAAPGLGTRVKNAAVDVSQTASDTAGSVGKTLGGLKLGQLVQRIVRRR